MFFRPTILFLSAALLFPVCSSAQIESSAEMVFLDPNPVTGLPYFAVQETEETGTSPNTTQTVSTHQVMLYRDSAGRMRREVSVPLNSTTTQETFNLTEIIDPTVHVIYWLDPRYHVAYAVSMPLQDLPPSSPAPDSPIPPPPPPSIPDDIDHYVSDLRTRYPNPKVTTEDLGAQVMEGFLVKGERTTSTFPADHDGSDSPMVEVDEVWTSTELGLTILSKHSDSRGGGIVSRVTSLDRSEPDPALFQVPPDYT